MKCLNFLIAIYILSIGVEGIEITCLPPSEVEINNTCKVTELTINSFNDRTITKNNALNFDNGNVASFKVSNQIVISFPLNLTGVFPNLHTVEIINSKLLNITSDDLKDFGENLTILFLTSNLRCFENLKFV